MSEYSKTAYFTNVEKMLASPAGGFFLGLTRKEVEQLLRVYRAALKLDPDSKVELLAGLYDPCVQAVRLTLADLSDALNGGEPRVPSGPIDKDKEIRVLHRALQNLLAYEYGGADAESEWLATARLQIEHEDKRQ